MNTFFKFIFLFALASCTVAGVSKKKQPEPVGLGWSKNAVNTAVFRRNSLVSHEGLQYTSFYDSSGYVVLARRRLQDQNWQVQRTNFKGNVRDAHNTISLIVDGDGYLHLSWDHHNNALRYARSVAPGALELTAQMPMTGKGEGRVTYPEFHRLPDGDLLFIYRDGGSGNGNLVLNRYSRREKQWRRLHDVLIDGEGQRNAYWQTYIDAQGTIHLSWVWRESPDVASNHDMMYARSTDGGLTWQKSTGEGYALPITAASAEYALRIPQKSELINQTSMCADAKGRPYIATYFRPAGTMVPQYHLIYHDGKGWQTQQISQRRTAFSLSGAGTKKIPISRPQIVAQDRGGKLAAYLLFRDEERGHKVSISMCRDLQTGKWQETDLSEMAVGNWEPTYDTELWQRKQLLHVFVQQTGQGDGEKLEELKPQPVYILEWRPGRR